MIEVVFELRAPGNHHEIARVKMPVVPRPGEHVEIDGTFHPVHSVSYIIEGGKAEAWVSVK